MHAHDILAHYADVIRTVGTEAGGDEAPQSMPAYMHMLCHTHAYADLLCVCYVIRAAGTEAGGDEAPQSIPAYLDTRRAACFNRWHDCPPGSVCVCCYLCVRMLLYTRMRTSAANVVALTKLV